MSSAEEEEEVEVLQYSRGREEKVPALLGPLQYTSLQVTSAFTSCRLTVLSPDLSSSADPINICLVSLALGRMKLCMNNYPTFGQDTSMSDSHTGKALGPFARLFGELGTLVSRHFDHSS